MSGPRVEIVGNPETVRRAFARAAETAALPPRVQARLMSEFATIAARAQLLIGDGPPLTSLLLPSRKRIS